MPVCAVRSCGERGQFACKKSEGQIISFHRFPSNPRIKAAWIRATGQRKMMSSWQPTKESTICSKHFNGEDFLTCTDLKISAVPTSEDALLDDHNEKEFLDGFLNDSAENSETDSADDVIELRRNNESITNKELTEVEERPIDHDLPESNEPISVQDSEPDYSETSSELEFTEFDSGEGKSGQLSVDTVENPQGSYEQTPYGIKISKAFSTRKRPREQTKTNIKMYRIDPINNTVRPVKRIHEDSSLLDPAKQPVIIRPNRNFSEIPIYIIKKSAESVDNDSQNNKVNQNRCKPIQMATKPKLVKIDQQLPANRADTVQKTWKATNLHSANKKVTPPTKMSIALDERCRPQLISASSNVSKPKPTISRLAPVVQKPSILMATSAVSTPTSTVSRTTSTVSRPTSTVSRPTSTVSTPSPAYSKPTPADSTPIPADSTPTTADSRQASTDLMQILADSMPTPADSTITSADSVPTPDVQNLDDSIMILDEYDTFAKHVATQLRQLSLESYLSAQGEIQSILSRYRIRDLNVINNNSS